MPDSPADTLRRAARLIRERAEAATPGPWILCVEDSGEFSAWAPGGSDVALMDRHSDGEHIAGMDPAVSLAVASLLLTAAAWVSEHPDANVTVIPGRQVNAPPWVLEALAVARAYLGDDQ